MGAGLVASRVHGLQQGLKFRVRGGAVLWVMVVLQVFGKCVFLDYSLSLCNRF